MSIEQTLESRDKCYGSFSDNAVLAQSIKNCMRKSDHWPYMRAGHKEALDMIASKIGRILNGDPDYIDNWHDIAGYATLVEQMLRSDADASRAD